MRSERFERRLDAAAPRPGLPCARVDADDGMLQFLADIAELPVERPADLETTALGAAYMAGRACGVYGDEAAFAAPPRLRRRFEPRMGVHARDRLLEGWRNAVRRTLSDPR